MRRGPGFQGEESACLGPLPSARRAAGGSTKWVEARPQPGRHLKCPGPWLVFGR
jgi:hypothetical protein